MCVGMTTLGAQEEAKFPSFDLHEEQDTQLRVDVPMEEYGQPPKRRVVLVVDDEPVLRLLASEMADEAGFSPVEASSADEAIRLLEERDDVCLVFTDVQMPGSMDGFGLASVIRKRWPQMAIIVTSGRAKPGKDLLPSEATFLPKPYHPEILLSAIRSAAQRKASNA